MAKYVRFETVKRMLMDKRDSIPLAVVERYSFGCPTPNEHGMSMRGGVNAAIKCLEDALRNGESVDIIRCRNCNRWLKDTAGCTERVGRCEFANWMVGENGFCIYGEKKVETENEKAVSSDG